MPNKRTHSKGSMAILHIKIKAILLRNRFFAHRQRGVYVLIPKRSGRAKDFEFVAGQQRQAAFKVFLCEILLKKISIFYGVSTRYQRNIRQSLPII